MKGFKQGDFYFFFVFKILHWFSEKELTLIQMTPRAHFEGDFNNQDKGFGGLDMRSSYGDEEK